MSGSALPPLPIDFKAIELPPPGGIPLTAARALELIEEAKRKGAEYSAIIYRLYEGDAHGALGYSNFGLFCAERLGIDSRAGYRHVEVAQLRQALSDKFVTGIVEASNAAIAKLSPLQRDPALMSAALQEAADEARSRGKSAPTARDVVRAVNKQIEAASLHPEARVGAVTGSGALKSLPDFGEQQTSEKPTKLQEAVSDAIAAVVAALEQSDSNKIPEAASAARVVLGRRRMGTSPETLANCLDLLLRAIARGES